MNDAVMATASCGGEGEGSSGRRKVRVYTNQFNLGNSQVVPPPFPLREKEREDEGKVETHSATIRYVVGFRRRFSRFFTRSPRGLQDQNPRP